MGPGLHPGWNVAQRFRLTPDGVDETVDEVHALLRERGRTSCTWEVGSSATPADLVERLKSRGIVDDREPYAVGMLLREPPPVPEEGIDARPVRTLDEFRAAQRVAEEAFGGGVGMDDDQVRARYEEQRGGGRGKTFIALADGEIVASATSTYVDQAVTLNGGAVLPAARGHGAYRALVSARWDDAVARGTPALVTQAGSMSRPILERLGFRAVCEIRILLDEFGD